jgi:hypothetical protein
MTNINHKIDVVTHNSESVSIADSFFQFGVEMPSNFLLRAKNCTV